MIALLSIAMRSFLHFLLYIGRKLIDMVKIPVEDLGGQRGEGDYFGKICYSIYLTRLESLCV